LPAGHAAANKILESKDVMHTIRPFEGSDSEYQAAAAVSNAVWPEYLETVQEWRHRDETRDTQYRFQRFVVELDGSIIGVGIYCEPAGSFKPGKFHVDGCVHPDHQERGVGTALYNHLMNVLASYDPVVITASTREDRIHGVRFLAQRGFKQMMRKPISHLEVMSFDHARFADYSARMTELGIKIVPLAEVSANDTDWKRRYWDLEWELVQDVPTTDPFTRQSFEYFEERRLGAPGFDPHAHFFALDGNRWVGMSALWTSQAEPDKLYTGLTGVVRSHRRKGIATALKVRGIDFAQRHGARLIETDNEENNPMYALNLALGFTPQPAWLEFEKRLKEMVQEGQSAE
jgi:GNAT superfamily N-acetyltransferase